MPLTWSYHKDLLTRIAELDKANPSATAQEIAETLATEHPDLAADLTANAVQKKRKELRRDRNLAAIASGQAVPSNVVEIGDYIEQRTSFDPGQAVLRTVAKTRVESDEDGTTRTSNTYAIVPKALAARVAEKAESDELLSELIALAQRPAPAPAPFVMEQGAAMVAVFSDLHLGKFSDADMVGGNFGYTTDIALNRAQLYLDKIKAKALKVRPSVLAVAFIGDNTEGSQMRPGQGVRTDASVGRQARILADLQTRIIAELAALGFPLWVIVGSGNHGRIGLKDEGLNEDNVEIIVAHAIRHAFADKPNVRFTIATTPEAIVSIAGKTIAFAHGDRIANGSDKAGWAYLRGLEDLHGVTIDILVTAHYHVFAERHEQNRVWLMNGSFDGGGACDYARNRLTKNTRPEQVMFGLDDQPGIAWRHVCPVAPLRSVSQIPSDRDLAA